MFKNHCLYPSIIVCALAITCTITISRADTIVLTNGDTLTGQIVSQDSKNVVLKSEILGKLTVPKNKIKTLKITSPVKEKTKEIKNTKNTKQQKAPSKAAKTAPPLKKNNGFFDSPFFKGWKTQISLGFSGSSGNTRSKSINAEFKTRKKTDDVRWIFDAQYFYGSSDGETSENDFTAKLTHDWLMANSNWLIFANGEYDYDQFKTWKSRVSGYLGVGYTFIDQKDLTVTARLGFGGTQHLGGDKKFTPEAMLGATAAHWKITENQTVNLSNTIYPALNDTGRFRNVTEANWKIKIDQDDGLSLKLGIQNEYDSYVTESEKHNNFKYYGALVYDF